MAFGIVVLASGRGSNFKAIADAVRAGKCGAKILALISDKPDAKALEIAKKYGIESHVVDPLKIFVNLPSDTPPSRKKFAFDEALLSKIDEFSPRLIVLAGYMRLLRSPKIFEEYGGRIINIHPSLLPKYPGVDAQKQAFDAGEKISGLTIHLVDETLDGGKILYQEKVDISDCKTADEAAQKILLREHIAYPNVIDSMAKGKILP